jgi:hypothetical protein
MKLIEHVVSFDYRKYSILTDDMKNYCVILVNIFDNTTALPHTVYIRDMSHLLGITDTRVDCAGLCVYEVIAEGFESLEELKNLRPELFI